MFSLIFNIITAILLVFCLFYSWRLALKIKGLKFSNNELVSFIKKFDDSSHKVEFALSELKNLKNSINLFSREVQKANMVSGDLSILSNKAEKIAGRLEEMIEKDYNELNKIRSVYTQESEDFTTQEELPIFRGEPVKTQPQPTPQPNSPTPKRGILQIAKPYNPSYNQNETGEEIPKKSKRALIEEALKQMSKKMGR
jgi:cell division protein ZapA (FtsZ GTPase activity inhibitor)